MHEGGSEQDAVAAAKKGVREAGGSTEAEAEAAAATKQEADPRHRGHYEGGVENTKKDGGRRGSLVHDAASVGAATAAAGGTPSDAGEEGRRQALRGGASEADAAKARRAPVLAEMFL